MLLLDTDILIDCLRGVPAARKWLESAAVESFGIPGIVAMELLVGCRNQSEQQHIKKFVTAFPLLWPDASEFARAYELLAAHRLATGVGIPDCVIAAMAIGRQTPLCTFNRKHFQVFAGLEVREPYQRG
ncbi:MAG: type II toxin-antitoxin system VapC family toxin [Bryobacterales bacterium]|nr:type II toxin-antitoxin system VapC family toxin [Bryobacterales bacterium]